MNKNTDNLYNTCKNLTEDDISKLIIQSDSLEEKNFYRMVSDYFIQQKQKKVIEMGLFQFEEVYNICRCKWSW